MKKYILTLALSVGLMGAAFGQLSITTLGNTNTIDFENTVAGVNNGQFLGLGFQPNPAAGELDSDAWATTGLSDGPLAFGGSNLAGDHARGATTDPETTGGIYAYTNGITNFLMVQPGATDFTPGTLTLRLQNNTGGTVTNLDVAYKIAARNDQAFANTLNFSHSDDDVTYTPEPALDFSTPQAPDMNGMQYVATNTISISGLNIANGAFYFLRWTSDDNGGMTSRDELGLDDIQVSALGIPGGGGSSTNSVTIATTANASELGTNGVFTLTSTGTNFPITVTYTVGGTATFTNDYDFLAPATSTSVVMNASPTTIEIVPVNDGDTNEIDPESVVITLDASGTGWTSGVPNSATVDIFAGAVIPPNTNGINTNLEGFSIILKKPKPGKTRKFKSAKGFPVKLFVVTASNTISSVAYAAVVAGNTNNTNNTNAITFITAGKIKPITKGKKFKQNIKAMAKSTKTTKAGVNIPVGTTSIEFIVRVDGTAGTNTGSAFFTNTIPTIVK